MKQFQLIIRATKRPETLERLLRIVRHRGFEVLSLNAETQSHELQLNLVVQSERDISLLRHQLEKVPDVLYIV